MYAHGIFRLTIRPIGLYCKKRKNVLTNTIPYRATERRIAMKTSTWVLSSATVLLIACLSFAAPPVPANYMISSGSPELQNEEQIWICPTDSTAVIAVWRDFRLGYRQVAIGREFFDGFWIDSLISPSMQVFSWQSDPTLTVDRDGNFYISVLDYEPNVGDDSSHISFLKSTDKGMTWAGPYTVVDTLVQHFEDKQFIVTDMTTGTHSGNLYVAWARFPNPNQIMFARSTDGAINFDDPIAVGPVMNDENCGMGEIGGGQFANPLVGSDGSVYVHWIGTDIDSTTCYGSYSLKQVKSTDGGVSFSSPEVIRRTIGNWAQIDGGIDVYNQPTTAADISGGPFDGNLYLAYANADSSYDFNIEFIMSTDGGVTWTEPYYINDDISGTIHDQFHPWMVINSEGTLAILFYDQRQDPGHTLFDTYAAYSFDGGESFTTNHRISETQIDPTNLKSTQGGKADQPNPMIDPLASRSPMAGLIAEYIGISTFNDYVQATWTGTAAGNQDVYGANWTIPFMRPRLLSPEDGSTIMPDEPIFDWATAWKVDDDSYEIEISRTADFASHVVLDYLDSSIYQVYPSLLDVDSTYYWRVTATRVSDAQVSEHSEIWSFTVVGDECIDTDGDGYGDPWEATNTCPPDNCPFTYNPAQVDTDMDGIGDACDLALQFYDTVSTGCTQLAVGNHGNFGRDGDYGATMDYAQFGDCDPSAHLYIYDGSPFITYVSGIDTVLEYTGYGRDTYTDVSGFNPIVPTVDLPDYQIYQSGTFATADQTLALEKTWWAPKHPDSCQFIIQRLKLFSHDGLPHSGLNIGEFVDWDIPSDSTADNYPGWSAPEGLLYYQGAEFDGLGCQPNDTRWGGNAMLGAYLNDSCVLDTVTGPYGAYLMDNLIYLYPSTGFVPAEQYTMMSTSGYNAYPGVPGAYDYNGVITYFHDLSLAATDTLVVYAALVSVQNGTVDSLALNLYKAQAWFAGHVSPKCGGFVNCGDIDDSGGLPDVGDLTYLIAYLFQGGPPPPVLDAADVDGSTAIDVGDLTYLVAYLFQGGPPPVC